MSLFYTGIATGTPSIFGYRPFFILSESMEPTIHVHQIVVGKVLEEDPKVGDVVAYEKETWGFRRVIIHRIVGTTKGGAYLLKGDNNPEADPPVQREQIRYRIKE